MRTPSCPVLFVPWVPPRAGDTLQAIQETDVSGPSLKLDSRFVTDERIAAVVDGMIDDVEIHFGEGRFLGRSGMTVDLAGRVVHQRAPESPKPGERVDTRFLIDDQPVPADLVDALVAFRRNDVGEDDALARTFADRTFVIGEETHLPNAIFGGFPADLRITLRRIEPGRATFDMLVVQTIGVLDGETRATVVYDTKLARLIEEKSTVTASQGGSIVARGTEHYTYRYTLSHAPPPRAASCAETLHIPYRAPRVGDRDTLVESVDMDAGIRVPDEPELRGHTRGSWTFDSEHRVLAVDHDTSSDVEIRVKKGSYRPIVMDRPQSQLQVLDGDVYRFGIDPQATRNGTPGWVPETALVARFDVANRYWLARLVTDRTFQVGVESVFPNEHLESLFGTDRVIVHLTLAKLDHQNGRPSIATFDVALEAIHENVTMDFRGTLTFDAAAARPITLVLRGLARDHPPLHWEGAITYDLAFGYP